MQFRRFQVCGACALHLAHLLQEVGHGLAVNVTPSLVQITKSRTGLVFFLNREHE